MIYDNNKEPTLLTRSDVLIIGSGPAGLTLADRLNKLSPNRSITIVESGSFDIDPMVEDMSAGTKTGIIEEELEELHARRVGGTANHWILKLADKSNGYRYAELTERDFDVQPNVPNSGWPICKDDLVPYYSMARTEYANLEENWEVNKETNKLASDVFGFGPTSTFTHTIPEMIKESTSVNLIMNATVTEIINRDGHVDGVTVTQPSGMNTMFRANIVILAAGGFDNARMLLESDIGNHNDVVGRYYMDHSLMINGMFNDANMNVLHDFHHLDMVDNHMRFLTMYDDEREVTHAPQMATMIFPKPNKVAMDGHASAQTLAEKILRERRMPIYEGAMQDFINVAKAVPYLIRLAYKKFVEGVTLMPGLATGGWNKIKDLNKEFSTMEVMSLVEQYPHAHNRVTLTDDVDCVGNHRMHVSLDWTENDYNALQAASVNMLDAVTDMLGKDEVGDYTLPDPTEQFYSHTAHHIMGTTRMNGDPKKGVVDANCKVYGVSNLYVAGSSVFTTGGYANPTLTILALSLRLADHLNEN